MVTSATYLHVLFFLKGSVRNFNRKSNVAYALLLCSKYKIIIKTHTRWEGGQRGIGSIEAI